MYKLISAALILLSISASVLSQCNPSCGEGLSCCNQNSPLAPQCYDPSTSTCPTGSDGPILCGNLNGHPTEACGNQCYDPSAYTCAPNGLLCPSGYQACGQACYSPSSYSCCNNQLANVGVSCSLLPAAWPTGTLVISTDYSSLDCTGTIASIDGFIQGQCYEYGTTSTRTFYCSATQVLFEACDQSCGDCSVEETIVTDQCQLTESTVYSCGSLAEPTQGQAWQMEFSDGNCEDLYNVAVYNNVCNTQNLHRSEQISCNATTYISETWNDQTCTPGGEGTTQGSVYTLPVGVCISSGTYSAFYGCGPISQYM